MAPKTSGAVTESAPAATASAEPAASGTESANQNDNVTNQLKELQETLASLQSAQARTEQEKNEALARAMREEAKYKGLQNQTTRTLQQAAQDRKALESIKQERGELAEIKSVLEVLASRVLDEPERKEMEFKQRELRLKLAEQAQADVARAAQEAAAQAVTSTQYQNPEDEKAQFVNFYFPGENIDPSDPNIDWGEGAQSTQEAFRRFNVSVLKIKNQKAQAQTEETTISIQKQTEEALKALQARQVELEKKTAEEIATAKTEAIDAARKNSEKKLRALGADVDGTPAPDGARRTFAQQLDTELDDSLLRTKKGQEEYARRIEAIKAQMRGR
jgi:hypothetical protein